MFSLGGYLGKWIWEVEEIPRERLIQYMAMYEISPWGPERDDLRIGMSAAVAYNLQRGPGAKSMAPKDFIPDYGPKKRQTAQEMENMFRLFANAHNARLENGKSH